MWTCDQRFALGLGPQQQQRRLGASAIFGLVCYTNLFMRNILKSCLRCSVRWDRQTVGQTDSPAWTELNWTEKTEKQRGQDSHTWLSSGQGQQQQQQRQRRTTWPSFCACRSRIIQNFVVVFVGFRFFGYVRYPFSFGILRSFKLIDIIL